MSHATHILLATAIRDHADAYESALEQHGVHVHVARTGEDALVAALGHPPDCIVIDLRLPDISGWDLCGQLRVLPDLHATPVILLERPTEADDLVDAIGDAMWHAHSARSTTIAA